MKKNRLIPVLLLKNGWLVQSKEFSRYQNLGNPTTAVKRISEWGSDELIYLDISKNDVRALNKIFTHYFSKYIVDSAVLDSSVICGKTVSQR